MQQREVRKCVVYCTDVDCAFKQNYRHINKNEGECALDLQTAIAFYNKHGFTTCEYGTGEKVVRENPQADELYKWRMKQKGRVE